MSPWCILYGGAGASFSPFWNESPHVVKTMLTFCVNTGGPFPPLFLVNVLLPLKKGRGLWDF